MSVHSTTTMSPPALFSSHFRDQTKQMKLSRGIYLKVLFGGSLAIIIAMFAIFSIYWGALWKTPTRNLAGIVVDFDASTVGSAVTQGLLANSAGISWTKVDASDYTSTDEVANRIQEEDAWVAVVINYNATGALNAAVQSSNSSYNGSSAITMIGTEARSENAYRLITYPVATALLVAISSDFASTYLKSISSVSNLAEIASNAPQVLTTPIGFTVVNTAPFDEPVATAMTFVGLIYLTILSFFIVMIGLSAREVSGLDKNLTTASLIRLRITSTFIAYFFISLFYSLLSRAFQVDFSRKFGAGGFVVFWMLNWVGMLALGLALEAMITLLTVRGVPFFLILLIISNVSVCFFPIDVLPGVYRYGYAFPFYNVSRAVRTILFGTKNDVGMNFGIIIAWIGVSCVTLTFFIWLRRRWEIQDNRNNEDAGVFSEDKRVEEA